MKKLIAILLVVFTLSIAPVAHAGSAADASTPYFSSEQAAQQHCPTDVVVWVNLPTGIYHFKGQRWYGNTKSGSYICQKDADKIGDRATKNGQ